MGESLPRSTAYVCAAVYGSAATIIVAGVSFFEGSLYYERTVNYNGVSLIQLPYICNNSTILDFLIFNPLAIFFLIKAKVGLARSYQHFNGGRAMSPYNQAGITIMSIAVGFSAMWFYFQGFVGRTFYTESFVAGPDGTAIISLTGWAIFFFTALFMSFLFLVAFEYGNYLLFVRSLTTDKFRFTLPPNISEDIKIAIKPCLYATYVLVTLFFVLLFFIFRDFYQFQIRESRRVWLFGPYIIACLIAFLPFWHLHQVMSARKNEIINSNNDAIEKDITNFDGAEIGSNKKINPQKLALAVNKIEKFQLFYKSIPVWPTSANALLIPNMSVVFSAITLGYKIVSAFYMPSVK